MAAIRQDAWSTDDDLILAEVTLRQIREGGTQLKAFEEVGERIGRTSAACGFRWNSCVRKQYEAAIQIAKTQRQKRGQMRKRNQYHEEVAEDLTPQLQGTGHSEDEINEQISMDSVLRYLRKVKTNMQDMQRQQRQMEKDLKDRDEELHRLRTDNQRLSQEANSVQNESQTVSDDYKALLQIMDRARKMAFLVDTEEGARPRFKMDANGNLERVE